MNTEKMGRVYNYTLFFTFALEGVCGYSHASGNIPLEMGPYREGDVDRVFGLGRSGNFAAIGFRVPKCEARGDLLYRLSYVTENNSFQVLIHNEELNDFAPHPILCG